MAVVRSYTIALGASASDAINAQNYRILLVDLPLLTTYFAAPTQDLQVLGSSTSDGTYRALVCWDGNTTWAGADFAYNITTAGNQILEFPGPCAEWIKISFGNVTTLAMPFKLHFQTQFQ